MNWSVAEQMPTEAIEAELHSRVLATENLVDYARYIDIPGVPVSDETEIQDDDVWESRPLTKPPAEHHILLLQAADDLLNDRLVYKGRTADGVLAFMPPGSAKSTYLDVVVPTYCAGKWPGHQTILTGYGSDILKKHGRRARAVCSSPQYQNLWGTSIRPDTRAADSWALGNDSEYMAGGLLSGLTGNRGDLLIWDDPIKGRQEAESETTRDSIWDAYQDDALTRLKPNGKQFGVQTRWHEDDPAGRILPEDWAGESGFIEGRDGRLWYVICLQAICERLDDPMGREIGEVLWPEWFNEKHFEPFKKNPRGWRSLFQQMPTAEDGTFFKREWFKKHTRIPTKDKEHINNYISLDSAETEDGGDYTFMIVWAVAPDRTCYAIDIWYGQVETDVWVRELVDRMEHFEPFFLVAESDSIFKAVLPFIRRKMVERNVRCPVQEIPHGGRNKPLRAQAFQGIAAEGSISLPDTGDGEFLLNQLMKFPNGRFDDGVDACAAFGRYIDKVWEQVPKEEKKETVVAQDAPITLKDVWQEPRNESW